MNVIPNAGNERFAWRILSAAMAAMLITLFTILVRLSSFADPNLHIDEEFYFLVGERMHWGLTPYVDIWDRKPLGIFIIAWLAAFFPGGYVAFNIAGAISICITAFFIFLICRLRFAYLSALVSAITYVGAAAMLNGQGGQSSVFFNLPLAAAAWLILRSNDEASDLLSPKILSAMALCGIAISINHSAFFVAASFGAFVVITHYLRSHCIQKTAIGGFAFCILGILPTALIGGYYAAVGHFPEWWNAFYSSNTDRYDPFFADLPVRLARGLAYVGPLTAFAFLGAVIWPRSDAMRLFVYTWLLGALLAYWSVPWGNLHFLIPLAAPASIMAAALFTHAVFGLAGMLASFVFFGGQAFLADYAIRSQSEHQAKDIANYIKSQPGDTLLLFDGPVSLYSLSGRKTLSPLVVPQHLTYHGELQRSHLDALDEVPRILAKHPDVIVTRRSSRYGEINKNWRAVNRYVARCGRKHTAAYYESAMRWTLEVYSECNRKDGAL